MTTVPTILAAAMALAAPDPFTGLAPLEQAELGDHRGGMMINGIPMDFAVVIRTTVEGAVAQGLQTTLKVNDQGGLASAATTTIGDSTGAAVTPTTNGGMALSLPSGTTILHQVEANQIQSLIANTRNDVSLNHRTVVNVDLPGFNALTQTWYSGNHAAQLGIDAAFSGLGRH
ncbi:MAG TPA: hypothetical protein VK196_12865 [Magnetospirillum sp.]|nr:hypothetical protein [Magnetospirillum sp.]